MRPQGKTENSKPVKQVRSERRSAQTEKIYQVLRKTSIAKKTFSETAKERSGGQESLFLLFFVRISLCFAFSGRRLRLLLLFGFNSFGDFFGLDFFISRFGRSDLLLFLFSLFHRWSRLLFRLGFPSAGAITDIVGLHPLDECHFGSITAARNSKLVDAGVAAGPVGELADLLVKKHLDCLRIANPRHRQAPVGESSSFRKRHQTLGKRAKCFGFFKGRLDPTFADKSGGQIGHKSGAVLFLNAELIFVFWLGHAW